MTQRVISHWDFSAPLDLRLQPSWQLAGLLLAFHAGAAICLLVSSMPAWLTGFAALAVACHLVYALREHALRCTQTAIVALSLTGEGRVKLITGSGQHFEATLSGGYARPMLTVLNLRLGPRRRRTVVLVPDMAEPHRLRELRVRLRRLDQAIFLNGAAAGWRARFGFAAWRQRDRNNAR